VVRSSVDGTLNGLFDAEADQICRAQRYERSAERVDNRAGLYESKCETKAGPVTLKVPKLRRLPFETTIIERYKRREASVEEALLGTRVSSGTVSRLKATIYRDIEEWRNREIAGYLQTGPGDLGTVGRTVENVSPIGQQRRLDQSQSFQGLRSCAQR
jgi:putative transposase